MLDQVKSGSSAGIATPARKLSRLGSPVAPRVDPSAGAPAPDDENASGHPQSEKRHRRDSDAPQRDDGAVAAPLERVAMSDDMPARRSTDSALRDLLAEARRLTPNDVPLATAPASATVAEPAPVDLAGEIFQKAVSAYRLQETLDTQRDKLRPGVIYSARF